MPPIYFVVHRIPEPLRTILMENCPLPSLEDLQPDTLTLNSGYWYWICRTFIHLKHVGLDVSLVENPVPGAICISHFDTMKRRIWAPDSFVVGVRADRAPLQMRDLEVVQTPVQLGRKDMFFIPH
jgi:hypothetical protein